LGRWREREGVQGSKASRTILKQCRPAKMQFQLQMDLPATMKYTLVKSIN